MADHNSYSKKKSAKNGRSISRGWRHSDKIEPKGFNPSPDFLEQARAEFAARNKKIKVVIEE